MKEFRQKLERLYWHNSEQLKWFAGLGAVVLVAILVAGLDAKQSAMRMQHMDHVQILAAQIDVLREEVDSFKIQRSTQERLDHIETAIADVETNVVDAIVDQLAPAIIQYHTFGLLGGGTEHGTENPNEIRFRGIGTGYDSAVDTHGIGSGYRSGGGGQLERPRVGGRMNLINNPPPPAPHGA